MLQKSLLDKIKYPNPALLAITLFVIAFIPRLINISFHSFHYDETSTALMVSQSSFMSMLKAIHSIEGTPPLFFIIEKIFVDVIGINNEFTLRFIPAIAGTLSCLLIFYITKTISTLQNAYLTFLVVCTSNFHIYISNEARCYSLLGFFLLSNLYCLIKWKSTQKQIYLIGFIVSLFLFCQIHYYCLFWIFGLFLSYLLIFKKPEKQIIIPTFITLFVSFLILLPFFLNQVTHEIGTEGSRLKTTWFIGMVYAPVKILIHAFIFKSISLQHLSMIDILGIVPSLLVLLLSTILFFSQLLNKKNNTLFNFVFISFLITFSLHSLVGPFVPTVHPRYMSHFLILIFPFIICHFSNLKKIKYFVLFYIICINVFALVNFYNKKFYYVEQYRDVGNLIKSYKTENKLKNYIIISDFMNAHALSFYLRNEQCTLFQFNSFQDLSAKVDPYKFSLFGNTLFSPLYKITYFPKDSSYIPSDILKQYNNGFMLLRNSATDLQFKTEQVFNRANTKLLLLKRFSNNQGDLMLYWWNYNGLE